MIECLANFLFHRRTWVVALIALSTIILGLAALRLEVTTHFSDLLPATHPYVKVHERYKEKFGGTNVITIMIEPESGDIFQRKVLEKIRDITRSLQYVDAVNSYQIISLASKKLKDIRASTYGIETMPLMWPDVPENESGIQALRRSVVSNPFAYGAYVSRDLKAGLITVDFIDRLIDYDKVYTQINKLVAKNAEPGIRIRVVGEPMLNGTVRSYLPETVRISFIIVLAMCMILFLTMRTWRGTLLPMVTAAVSALISLGIIHLAGFNFDPLIMVIVFLISARAISHSVQFCAAFDDERQLGVESSYEAAKRTFIKLFRPSVLGLVVDIGSILVVTLTPIPLLQKAAIIGAIWLTSLLVSACILVPIALSWVKQPKEQFVFKLDITRVLVKLCRVFASLATKKGSAVAVLVVSVLVLVLAGKQAINVTVGDANPGSPILWPNSQYNRDWGAINQRFQGSDRMFVVVKGDTPDALKQPAMLNNMTRFQRFVETQPQIGGSISLVDIIAPVNIMVHEGNPRFDELGRDATVNGELAYMYSQGSEPGDMDRFSDINFQIGAVTIFFRDHQGDTIRAAIARIKEYIAENPMPGVHYELAGGLVGVLAAVNEIIFADQIKSIALALMVLFVFCAISYRSAQAGLFFLPLILLSNTVTFAFMKWIGIGININTLPIAALGIGLGVDYAFYIVDRIKEQFERTKNLEESVRFSLETAGRGVLITGLTMVLSVILWYLLSSLRFQAEMGLLIALWMTTSVIAALLVIPSMIYLLRPVFVVGYGTSREGLGHTQAMV
ncbi:MAG: RND transporter [Rugosibacter sp.]|nr:MAG: RND transporter [Rugosibacter sp.]